MSSWIKKGLIGCWLCLFCVQINAASLADIQVSNGQRQARITFSFVGDVEYAFSQNDSKNVVLDIRQRGVIQGLPLSFSGNNLVKTIRSGQPREPGTVRLEVVLTQPGRTDAVKRKHGANSTVVFTINSNVPPPARVEKPVFVDKPTPHQSLVTPPAPAKNPFSGQPARQVISSDIVTRSQPVRNKNAADNSVVVVAIDPGHGGQDPGATGPGGTHEKNITIAIARKLDALLNSDPMFKGVMTRDGDYYISVLGRSDVARKKNANLLISIHADAAPNRDVTGASVWVLSNSRANSELAGWLEQHEKQSELLGGAGDMLANSQTDPYLSQAVLDLQFGHSQRVGYDVATKVLDRLDRIGDLHKRTPEHASLGVLRSPDIPSLLVETGFISNASEERLLKSDSYQQKVAEAIYQGLRDYFQANPLEAGPSTSHAAGK